MCGIGGIYHYKGAKSPVTRERLKQIADALIHRGPDDEGYYLDGNLGLCHRRLSIIDLSGGHQPLANEDESIWVICNGEIYDFAALRQGLIEKGHRFRTGSDSEILVHLYEEDGESFIKKLRGMFAFALWDSKKKVLILGRDRLGKKPLYYYQGNEGMVFASELKGIKACSGLELNLDDEILGYYLDLGYLPQPYTKYREVKKLPPAHYLVVSEKGLRLERYWEHPPLNETENAALSFSEAKETLRAKLSEAVNIRLVADVPLGAFLSGGVDSSLVVALMSRLSSAPVKTFNISFSESSYDESKYAREVAQLLGTEHHEIPVDYRIEELLEKVLCHFDEPFADSSAIPQYLVCQAAREHVTVALSGDAGDEVFGGYRRYVGRKLVETYQRLCPKPLREGLFHAARATVHEGDEYIGTSFRKLFMRFLNLARHYETAPFSPCIPFFTRDQMKLLLGSELYARQKTTLPFSDLYRPEGNGVAQMLFIDQQSYLSDDILTKVDRMSMAHALEVRSPLLDHVLIEWAATLPLNMKIKGFTGKYLLKKLAEDYLPKKVLYRRKQGFSLPLPKWFRNELKSLVSEALLNNRDKRFNPQLAEKLLAEHQSGKRDWSQQLWALLSLKYTFN